MSDTDTMLFVGRLMTIAMRRHGGMILLTEAEKSFLHGNEPMPGISLHAQGRETLDETMGVVGWEQTGVVALRLVEDGSPPAPEDVRLNSTMVLGEARRRERESRPGLS